MPEQHGREVLTLAEAAKYIGRIYGVKPSVATVWRWARKGLKGHRLPIISIGRRCRTTTAAVREFIERLSTDSPHGQEHRPAKAVASSKFTPEQRAEAERQRADEIAAAKERLRQYSGAGRSVALSRHPPDVENANPSRPTTGEDNKNHQQSQRSF
jgi:hypothetical protein